MGHYDPLLKASLVPGPVRAIRVTRGGLEPGAIDGLSRQA